VDDDGGAIIGANKTNESITGHNFFSRTYIFKVDELGEIQWEYESHALDLFDIAYDMVKTPDGGIVIATGKGIEHQINSEDSQLRWSCYLLKLNTNHQKEWGIKLNDIEPTTSSGFTKVVEAPNGDGYTAMGILFEDVSYEEGLLGSCLFKVSPNGTNLWTRYYTYLDSIDINPKPYDLKTTPDGGYIIVGETKPQYPDGQQQRAWIMKLDEHGCLIPGCEENDSTILSTAGLPDGQPLQLAIHPNPTGSYLNFQLRHATAMPTASFRIVDAHGRTVSAIDSRMPWSTHVVPVHDWASGVYFLQYLENGQVRHSERFVVQ
jgi:hypothetical protein